MNTTNPFIYFIQNNNFQQSNRDDAVPFDLIQTEHFLPALDEAISIARSKVAAIKKNSEAANFENTILALENSGEGVELVSGIYFNLFSAEASEAHQALAKDISPKLASYSSEISLDAELFNKIKAVYDRRSELNLNPEQTRLVEKYYRDFTRNGALLNETDKETLRQIDQKLSVLAPKFSENVLKATNSFEMIIEQKADLIGLPEGTIEAAAMAAEQKGYKGKWLFNLQAPSYVPFLQYAQNRELRKKIWTAVNSRSFKDQNDNQDVVLEIVRLRDQRAKLLGFSTHAEFVLADRMAQTPKVVNDFLQRLLVPSKKAAEKDIQELRSYKRQIEANDEIMPWDMAYYSEKLKEERYKFNSEELRPYFKLENVVTGVFEHARRLYGLNFKEVVDVPKYHPDVRVYEVRESETQQYVGLFYTDFFPRETKKGGAWMTLFREQGITSTGNKRPHVSIVCNFTKPTSSKPSLLSYDEVQTLFHEFGHALHGLLSNTQYRSLAGTNVLWDFVELPSQIMENWVGEKEGLDVFATHYETGASLPSALVDKIKRSEQFQAGYMSLRQLTFGSLDMKWHSTKPEEIKSVEDFENMILKDYRVLPAVPGTNMSCSFSHIFAGGYSAGYYSYKWAEVLDADAFEYFKEKGIFNKEVASKFKEHILSRGNTDHPMELYKKFRGREPDPNSLLRRDGLIEA